MRPGPTFDRAHFGSIVGPAEPGTKGTNSASWRKWTWWSGAFAVVCGAELAIAAAIGGAGIGVFVGPDGALVVVIGLATLAHASRSRLAARRRARPPSNRAE